MPFPVDGRLKGPNGTDARSGIDEALSFVNYSVVRYGGGPVPQTLGSSNGPITMFNSRPAITNTRISDSRQTGTAPPASGTVGAITADFDSFREDEIARGPLIRRVEVVNNSINGIFIRAELSGQAMQTNAINYPNLVGKGGTRNFVVDDPLPHVLTTRLVIGQQELVNTGGVTTPVANRLYVQPGMMFKMPTGAAIDVLTAGASLNMGDRTYIDQFDSNPNFGPDLPMAGRQGRHAGRLPGQHDGRRQGAVHVVLRRRRDDPLPRPEHGRGDHRGAGDRHRLGRPGLPADAWQPA